MLNLPSQNLSLPDGTQKPLEKFRFRRKSAAKAPAKEKRASEKKAKREWIEQRRQELSPKMKADIIARDGGICQLCLKPCTVADPPHVDHVIPLAQYGRVCESNLATLHQSCNQAKGASTKASRTILRNIGHAIKPEK